jgi:uncharacterized protein YndB with AHSA1/START domain
VSIAPVIRSVEVKAPPAKAFDLFCSRIGEWWPSGKTVADNPHVAIVIEPHAEGRWFERDAEGHETQWGKVLAFEPPSRLLLGWQLNGQWTFDPNFLTEVELTFQPTPGGSRARWAAGGPPSLAISPTTPTLKPEGDDPCPLSCTSFPAVRLVGPY